VTLPNISRRDLNRASLSLLAAVAAKAFGAATGGTTETHASTRRKVIQQVLPGDPPREIVLIGVHYPPGTGSPAHLHANGVMAFVVAGTIISQLGEGPEETFHAGEAWWGLRAPFIAFRVTLAPPHRRAYLPSASRPQARHQRS